MNLFFNDYFSDSIPDNLHDLAEQAIAQLVACLNDEQIEDLKANLDANGALKEQLLKALVGSQYILDSCLANPTILFCHLLSDAPFSPITPVKIFDAVNTACSDALSVDEFNSLLRILRRRFMTMLYWRDINNLADFNEVSTAMTALAEVFVQQALDFNYRSLANKHGFPVGCKTGHIQPMLVIGMGKLGGKELNVSSDIDLIFTFPESGKTEKITSANPLPIKPIENQQFFIFLGQRLIKSLNDVTAQGFVFRVDMRLRPYGDSGPLVSNFAALENYYETQGRDWERFASVKARVIACANTFVDEFLNEEKDNKKNNQKLRQQRLFERESADNFYAILTPFVYRKYIDYTMIESLRNLKAMIVQEVRRKQLQGNIKLGKGGIREVEFIVQSFQLVRGGRDQQLQTRNLLQVIDYLGQANHLSEKVLRDLQNAYIFLRKIEHSLQAANDTQTQSLPTDKSACERLAWLSGFATWEGFVTCLDQHRNTVNTEFERVFADKDTKQESADTHCIWGLLWTELREKTTLELSDEQKHPWIQTHFDNNLTLDTAILYPLMDRLILFKSNRRVIALSQGAQKKLDILMPTLLTTLLAYSEAQTHDTHEPISTEQTVELMRRVIDWLESIVMRTSYLSLLIENPHIIKHLLTLFKSSSWVVETLTRIPALLDELLNPAALYSLPEKDALRDELRQRLLRLEPDDLEGQMEVLRYFKLAHYLHVAACEITGSLALMKVSDYLTLIAEVVLEQVLSFAWQGLVTRHGHPEGASQSEPRFLVVGYGKLGGIEMSYSSDLDLVFICDANAQGETHGPRPLDNQTFYARLGQKMIHMMNTRSMSGQLYEIDMRLRPSGNSGMLVTSITAFERYQQQEAWVWEHQALVRARAVAGDSALAARFSKLRRDLLCQPREPAELTAAVSEMREKMRGHLDDAAKADNDNRENNTEVDEFHLKQGAGGIVDIEFMVQYAVLAWSAKQPELCQWTDNIRLLESLHHLGFLDADQSQQLIDIYQLYRLQGHRLALQQNQTSLIGAASFTKEREQIRHLWDYFFNSRSDDK